VFKAVVVIAVCLMQAPRFRQLLRRRRRGAAAAEPAVAESGLAEPAPRTDRVAAS
jgi:galactofuranose transport system permease protein